MTPVLAGAGISEHLTGQCGHPPLLRSRQWSQKPSLTNFNCRLGSPRGDGGSNSRCTRTKPAVVGLAYFIATALEVLPIISAPDPKVRQTLLKVVAPTAAALAAVSSAAET